MKKFVTRQHQQITVASPNHTIIIRYRHGLVTVLEIAGGVHEELEAHRANNTVAAHNIMEQLAANYQGQ